MKRGDKVMVQVIAWQRGQLRLVWRPGKMLSRTKGGGIVVAHYGPDGTHVHTYNADVVRDRKQP